MRGFISHGSILVLRSAQEVRERRGGRWFVGERKSENRPSAL